MSSSQVPNADKQGETQDTVAGAARGRDTAASASRPLDSSGMPPESVSALSEHLTTLSISSAPNNHEDEKPLIVKMTKVQLDDAIESARRARQVDTNGQHVCGLECPLRGALGHGGETST